MSGVTNNINNGFVPLPNAIQPFIIELDTLVLDKLLTTVSDKTKVIHRVATITINEP